MKIIVPVSGGKDSQACLILAMAVSDMAEVVPVFYETKWDHPLTYEHLTYMEKKSGLKIQRTTYEQAPGMPDLIRKTGKFPWGVGRFCTDRYKSTAFTRWVKEKHLDTSGEVWLGIRTSESGQRARKYKGYAAKELYDVNDLFPGQFPKYLSSRFKYRLPVLDWTTEEVFAFSKQHGWEVNPLYADGFDRVGCFPCLLAGKATQERAFNTDFGKKQWAIIEQLEKDIGEKYKYQARDLTCEACKI